MRRLLILLLMFLLPMQVFAGMAESQANEVAMLTCLAQNEVQPEIQQNAAACKADADCTSQDSAVDDVEMHVDLGDETVPAFPFVFAAAAIASTPALSNDKARQPPFLPPVGPPPRA